MAAGPLSAVYARQANPLIDRMVQRRRRALGCGFVANDAGARPLLAELVAGRSLGVLADLRVDSGAPLPFFGEAAPTTLVPARLALKFGCPLVPILVERLAAARFRVTACPPLRSRDTTRGCRAAGQGHDAAVQRDCWRPGSPSGPTAWQCLKRRWSKDVVRRRLAAAAMVDTGGRGASAIAGSSG